MLKVVCEQTVVLREEVAKVKQFLRSVVENTIIFFYACINKILNT